MQVQWERQDRTETGFTLLELCIAIAIMMILAAMAIPGVNRARTAANEGAAIGSLRTINESQYAFVASCGSGFYAPSLTVLGTPLLFGIPEGFIATDLANDPSTKSDYTLTLTPGAVAPAAPASCNGVAAGSLVWSYYVGADPIPGGGIRFFGMNQGGTIYTAPAQLPVTQSGQPAGSTAIE
jgi:type II secretory pathway pseudopilin PulG